MDANKKPWPVGTVYGIRERIDTNPDFQRPAVWTQPQKQLLIDTILRGYDIPKFYWRKTGKHPDRYDVVDGQQRLRALWEFQSGKYAVATEAESIDGYVVGSMRYEGLPDELRIRFDTYPLDVVVLLDTDEDEVREMFLRLQNGTTLKAQERRNAMPGNMRSFVKELAGNPFFNNCGFSNSRFTFDHIAAQMTLIELTGGPANVRDADLNLMYAGHQNFDSSGSKAKKIRRVLKYLADAFPEKTPELKRFSVISLYALVSHLLERYVVQERATDLAQWFLDFEALRREQEGLPADEADPEMVLYQQKISQSTDRQDSISWRHEFLLRKFFEAYPDIELKDDQRLFTHEQRLAIYRRDKGLCQVRLACTGLKCDWDAWHADHIVPWSRGGKTVVENGQVSCLACNAMKAAA